MRSMRPGTCRTAVDDTALVFVAVFTLVAMALGLYGLVLLLLVGTAGVLVLRRLGNAEVIQSAASAAWALAA